MEIDWSVGAASLRAAIANPGTIFQISKLSGIVFDIAYVLPLLALARPVLDSPAAVARSSRLLRVVTKVVVVAWGFWLTYLSVCLVAVRWVYSQIQLQGSVLTTRPTLEGMILDALRRLVTQGCLFVAPYVVYKALRSAPAETSVVSEL